MNFFDIFGTIFFLILFNINDNQAALNSSVISSNKISSNPASLPDEIRCITSSCRPHNITYTWTITNFSIYETMNDYYFQSPRFFAPTNNDSVWDLSFTSSSTPIQFWVFLTKYSKVNKTVAKFRISILNHSGEELWSEGWSEYKMFGRPGYGTGYCFSIKNDEFFRKKLIQNDTLIISCKLSYYIPGANTNTVSCQQFQSNKTTTTPQFNTSDLIENLESLFENPSFADVLISVNGKNYWAHKNILAARSVIFASLIRETKTTEYLGRTLLNITDIDEEVTGEILRYIYTGKCKNLSKLSKGLLVAANKYALAPLRKICAEEIGKSLTVENAAHLLTFADTHGPDELKTRVIQFIVNKPAQVLNSEAWKNMVSLNSKLVNEVFQAVVHSGSGNS